jgi:hypothetical protein
MADILGPTLISRDNDANTLANPIFVNLSDGTDTLAVNADGSLNVTVTGGASNTQFAEDTAHVSGDIGTEMLAVRRDTAASGVSADGDYATLNVDSTGRLWCNVSNTVTVSATDLDIRDLVFATDKVDVSGSTLGANSGVDIGDVTINNAVGASAVNIQDGGNSITVDGSVSITGSVTVTATDLDIRDLAFATDKVDVSGSSVTVSATDLDIRDLTLAQDAVKISGNSTANSLTNPIFVQLTSSIIAGEVNSFNTGAAVAAAGTSNHDYTVVTAMKLKSVICSASGKCKFEIQVGPVASLVSKAVAFVTPTNPTVEVFFDPPIEIPTTSTGTVRVIRTNRENQAQDVYSTIIGLDA